MTDLMIIILSIICVTVILIAGIMIYKVMSDCNERIARRLRQQEVRRGRSNNTTHSSGTPH